MDPLLISFYVFATIAVIAAGGVISVRNPVHAVLFLILTFFSVACVWLLVGSGLLQRLVRSLLYKTTHPPQKLVWKLANA